MFQKILVALDQSEIGELTFKTGMSLATMMKAQIKLLHVIVPTGTYIDPVYPMQDSVYPGGHTLQLEEYQQAWKRQEEEARALLKTLQDRAQAEGTTVETVCQIGDPGHAICQVAADWEADLIVVGRHHRSKVSELFWGSVSNFVMHHANCFVLVAQE